MNMQNNILRRNLKHIRSKYYKFLGEQQMKRRARYLKPIRKRLNNCNFSLLSNNCVGGVLLHELGLRFNSPFVNLFLIPHDYIELLSKPDYYFNKKLYFVKDSKSRYPVAYIDSLRIDFVHYKTSKEAEQKWIERIKRINWDNLFVILTEQGGCTHEDLMRFDNLPYKNKIVFTKQQYPDIRCCYPAEGYENQEEVRMLLDFRNRYSVHRKYDFFDFVDWFNSTIRSNVEPGNEALNDRSHTETASGRDNL